jgi:hypothetical protein
MIKASDYPELKLSNIQKLIERQDNPPGLVITGLFGEDNWESDNIKWETQLGNIGLAPFIAPGSPSPKTGIPGVGMGSAYAAFWAEKIFFGEEFLNNLRQPGTQQYMSAQKHLAKATRIVKNRNMRRKEWLMAKMITGTSFTYLVQNGPKYTIDYNVPSDLRVALAPSKYWIGGTNPTIVEDIFDMKLTMRRLNGGNIDYALFTSEVLKALKFDAGLRNLLSKSAYGTGDFLANPIRVLQEILEIKNMIVYDETYQLRAYLTAASTGSSTTVYYVDNATDFEVGDVCYIYDMTADTKEEVTISAVDVNASTITMSAVTTNSYKAQEDYIYINKTYLPTNKFSMFCSTVEGEKIAEFANAPFALNRTYGMRVDNHEEWDPDGIAVRVQNKGIGALYQRDAIGYYQVGA